MLKAKKYLWVMFLWFLCAALGTENRVLAQRIGTWQLYPSYHNATDCRVANGRVFVLANGNLYSYSPEDSEVQTYSKQTGLSSVGIQSIEYNEQLKKLLILYSDANMDILDVLTDDVVNMPQLQQKALSDKTVNDITMEGNRAYLSCNFGIVVVDMDAEAFVSIYNPGYKVLSCVAYDGMVYAQTQQTEKYAIMTGEDSSNLQDPAQWKTVGWGFQKLRRMGEYLYGMTGNLVYAFKLPNILSPTSVLTGMSMKSIRVVHASAGDRLLAVTKDAVYEISSPTDTPVKMPLPDNFSAIDYTSGTYYIASGYDGFAGYKLVGDAWSTTTGDLTPDSPIRDYFGYVRFAGNRLLVAGGLHNYTDSYYPGTVMTMDDESWTNFEEDDSYVAEGFAAGTYRAYVNATSIVQDPYDDTHHFASTMGHGIYEFRDGKLVNHYDCLNSPLTTILPNSKNYKHYVRITGLQYDGSGNLWMFNNQVDTVIRILKRDGTWAEQYYESLEGLTQMGEFRFLDDNTVWFNSTRISETCGVGRIRYNGTPAGSTPGSLVFKAQKATNQDGVAYEFDNIYCMEVDQDGQIWLGTNLGPFVIEDPSDFSTSTSYKQVKINRTDGSGLADYLLSGIAVTAIAVDGANRKWLGTDGQGVYLLSADGQETLQHFTKDNSPMPSDNITSIAVNEQTGAVMFGSMSGLACYYSDAVAPAESLEEQNVYAYPNPVRPDYYGDIVVRGLSSDCTVKICTTSGQLVAQGTSNGGMFSWNGCNQRGGRVGAGVYNVYVTDATGSTGVVCRIVIIR